MIFRDALDRRCVRRLRAQLAGAPVPRHVVIAMDVYTDGPRQPAGRTGAGQRYGPEHLDAVLGWCAGAGIRRVTVALGRSSAARYPLEMVERVVAQRLTHPAHRWRLHLAGGLDALPDATRRALWLAEEVTGSRSAGYELTVAVGSTEQLDAGRSGQDMVYRPGFRQVQFLRALRAYAMRATMPA
ncbi:undecaprenyl diphosphate synthase family protein [Rhizomonospora bruguierae]|uniref:hypothetical protein n=1 Tax=Rhizomonospora bruguierae TaxID=1581705 RepID=UPI001BD0E5FB|nr:hypothetical protein [Micromonospora sp. NBRC 107566]